MSRFFSTAFKPPDCITTGLKTVTNNNWSKKASLQYMCSQHMNKYWTKNYEMHLSWPNLFSSNRLCRISYMKIFIFLNDKSLFKLSLFLCQNGIHLNHKEWAQRFITLIFFQKWFKQWCKNKKQKSLIEVELTHYLLLPLNVPNFYNLVALTLATAARTS